MNRPVADVQAAIEIREILKLQNLRTDFPLLLPFPEVLPCWDSWEL